MPFSEFYFDKHQSIIALLFTTLKLNFVAKRNMSLLVDGELGSDLYDALILDGKKERLGILDEVCFIGNLCRNYFLKVAAPVIAYCYSIEFRILIYM
jgi:hypothetical protein